MLLSHEVLAELVGTTYPISIKPGNIISIPSGRNALYQLADDNQIWIAKLAITDGDVSQIKREAAIIQCLQSRDSVITPSILLDLDGVPWIIPAIHPTALLVREALVGPLCAETPQGYAMAGAALAQLHQRMDLLDSLHGLIPPPVLSSHSKFFIMQPTISPHG